MNECTAQERSAVNEQRLTTLEAKVDAHIENSQTAPTIIGTLVLAGVCVYAVIKCLIWAVDNGHA
jgi:hypothetical protein